MRNNDSQSIPSPAWTGQAQTAAPHPQRSLRLFTPLQGGAPQYVNPFKLFLGSFIPEWLERMEGISPGAKLTYGRLCRFADKETGIAHPKQTTLAACLGFKSRTTIKKYLAELKRAGLIEARRHGLNKANSYRFLNHPAMASFRMATRGGHQDGQLSVHQDGQLSGHPSYKENQFLESEGRQGPPTNFKKYERRRWKNGDRTGLTEFLAGVERDST
jgi:hypothetical protein